MRPPTLWGQPSTLKPFDCPDQTYYSHCVTIIIIIIIITYFCYDFEDLAQRKISPRYNSYVKISDILVYRRDMIEIRKIEKESEKIWHRGRFHRDTTVM